MTESSIESEKYYSKYEEKHFLGKGAFSKVKLGINKETKEKVAIKIISKSLIKDLEMSKRINLEIKILKTLNHINIIKLIEIIETSKNYYIITEYCENGELFNHIIDIQRLSEEESSYFFYQLINGLEYIHSKGIVHRDLKPENLLLKKGQILKIIDFGLSNFYNDNNNNLLSTPCGSPSYASPEMISGKKYNGFKRDIWSSGIILFAMLCGFLPFEDNDNCQLFEKIKNGILQFPNFLSQLSKDLIQKILVVEPKERISIQDIKKHQFYLKGKEIFEEIHKELIKDEEKDNENENERKENDNKYNNKDKENNNVERNKNKEKNNNNIENKNNNNYIDNNNINNNKNIEINSVKNNNNTDNIHDNNSDDNNNNNEIKKKKEYSINYDIFSKLRNIRENKIKEKRNKGKSISIKTESEINSYNSLIKSVDTNPNRKKKEFNIEDFIIYLTTKSNLNEKRKKLYKNNNFAKIINQIKKINSKEKRKTNLKLSIEQSLEKENKCLSTKNIIKNNNNLKKNNEIKIKSAKSINSKYKNKIKNLKSNFELYNINLKKTINKKTTNNTSNSLLNNSNSNNNLKTENSGIKKFDKNNGLKIKKRNYLNSLSNDLNLKNIFFSNFNFHKIHSSITNKKINDLIKNNKPKLLNNMSSEIKKNDSLFTKFEGNCSKKNFQNIKSVKSIKETKKNSIVNKYIKIIDEIISNRNNYKFKKINGHIKLDYINQKLPIYIKTELHIKNTKKTYKDHLLSSKNKTNKK